MLKLKICFFALFLLSLLLIPHKVLGDLSNLLPLFISNDKIGSLFSNGLEKQYGLANDSEAFMRIQNIGQRLLAKIHTEEKYDFAVLNSHEFNACSIYGGHIRVFHGLASDTRNSNNELAAVLAHEIAHNELGHNKGAIKTFKIAYALELANISQKMPTLLLAGANAALAKRSRQHEKAADQQALEWMSQAGFSIKGAIAVFRRIEAEHKAEQKRSGGNLLNQRFAQVFATHPEPATRVAAAEDFLFEQKYGRTFKEVLGVSSRFVIDKCPIIVAHYSQWNSPLREISQVAGMGIFNPATQGISRNQDVLDYLKISQTDHLVCATGDNDFHAMPTATLNRNYTFIKAAELKTEDLLSSIKACKTYVSTCGIKIVSENFRMGKDYPKIQQTDWQFTLDLPTKIAFAPKVKVFRNGQEIAEIEKTNSRLERQPIYRFVDKNLIPGRYWYILYVPSELVTSPITVEITGNPNDPTNFAEDNYQWRKGIVHCHSLYSDGKSTLEDIWTSKDKDIEFIFMTDHSHSFKKEEDYSRYVKNCQKISPLLIPGVEYSLDNTNKLRHLLILGLERYLEYKKVNEEDFFHPQVIEATDKQIIARGPIHLGDDVENSEIHYDSEFGYNAQDAILKLRVKGTPRKDPVIYINRREIARVVTSDDKWHWYEFPLKKDWLYSGKNLFHIQAVIPDRWETFDDCEVADIYILRK